MKLIGRQSGRGSENRDAERAVACVTGALCDAKLKRTDKAMQIKSSDQKRRLCNRASDYRCLEVYRKKYNSHHIELEVLRMPWRYTANSEQTAKVSRTPKHRRREGEGVPLRGTL